MTAFSNKEGRMYRIVSEYNAPLIIGVLLSLIIANTYVTWYAINIGGNHTVLLIVNEYGMAFFFARAMKETWEAIVSPKGALHYSSKDKKASAQRIGMPLIATAGGWLVPFTMAYVGCRVLGLNLNPTQIGIIPTATDIVFSLFVLKMALKSENKQVRDVVIGFVMTLALVDDGIGLGAIGAVFHEGGLALLPLIGLTGGAILLGVLSNKVFKITNHWWYFLLMNMSWFGLYWGGLPPALGFCFIIPTMPHAHNGDTYFGSEEESRPDTLDRWANAWHAQIDLFLFVFAFVNCGITFGELEFGSLFWLLLVSVVIGKPLGILGFVYLGTKVGFRLPVVMTKHHLVVGSFAAGIGLTVMIFITHLAFAGSGMHAFAIQSTAAALGSLIVSGGLALVYGRFIMPYFKKAQPTFATQAD